MKLNKLIESLIEAEIEDFQAELVDKENLRDVPGEKPSDQPNVKLTPTDLKILSSLEQELEKEINRTVPLEENKKFFNKLLQEKASTKGFEYEAEVLAAVRKAGAQGNMTSTAGASAALPDADFNVFGDIYPVEVKLDSKAQMGGSSVRYARGGSSVSLVKELEPDTAATLLSAVKNKGEALDQLLAFLHEQSPSEINQRAVRFPCSVTKEAWEEASQSNLLVNIKVSSTTAFIERHYSKKGVHYIQIGGAGLFYLKENPANLPIPKLDGEIQIELRSARSGSKKLSSGVKVVSGGIRVQGRLKTKNLSPYTLDNPESILEMFKHMQANKASQS